MYTEVLPAVKKRQRVLQSQ